MHYQDFKQEILSYVEKPIDMEKQYELSNCTIRVYFEKRHIKIEEATALQKYLSSDIHARSIALVDAIKLDYLSFFKKELNISVNSIIVEIWGHALASVLANRLAANFKAKLIQRLALWIKDRSDSIDCGEKGMDQNRILWDTLSTFKRLIVLLLPKRLKNGQATK